MTPELFFEQLKSSYPDIPFYGEIQTLYVVFSDKNSNYKNKLYNHSWLVFFKFVSYLCSKSPSLSEKLNSSFGGCEPIDVFLLLTNGSMGDKFCTSSGNPRQFIMRKVAFPRIGACKSGCVCLREMISKKAKNRTPEELSERERKYQETMLQRYGVRNAGHSDELVHRMKTSLANRSDEEKYIHEDRRKKTCLGRYGVENVFMSPEKQSLRKNTIFDRYGVEHVSQIQGFKEKVRTTNLRKYGVENTLQIPGVQNKAQSAIINRQDEIRDHRRQNGGMSFDTIALLNDAEKFEEYMLSHSVATAAKELGIGTSTIRRTIDQYDLQYLVDGNTSSYEREIASFLDLHGVKYEANSRKQIPPKEVDFYLPDYKLAIEFNGLYWHSTNVRPDTQYHRDKYLDCQDKGIRLVMINEDEWINRTTNVKSRLLNILGRSDRGAGGRKLIIEKISNQLAQTFFEMYHLQGSTGTLSAAYGAYHDNILIAAIGYNYQRGSQAVELIRFATDGKSYPGAFSRLFHHSRNLEGYEAVISFADLRYSEGKVYEKNGFVLENEIRPDYRYVIGDKTFHKSSFTKAKIAKRFNIDIEGKTERQLMEELNIPRIYDCGKLKFKWGRVA